MTTNPVVPVPVVSLFLGLSEPKPMRRGSLNERQMKCGQAGCACQRDRKARHGPYYTLTQAVSGKTRSRYVSEVELPVLRRQIAAGREFRQRVEALWEACEQWADSQLESSVADSEAAKKKGFRRRWKPRSSMK